MEIETHDSAVPVKNLVKVAFKLGTESYTVDAVQGDTHNVLDHVPDESLSDEGDEDDAVKCPVKPKKTKI
ncbi:unnamed protein product [Brassica oleracea var. botrytis]|uniref:Uncharacterized protein n=1 Tax=Brassica oleracea TaxID=3712 RepID=A0A3P6FNW1_BRAOL|nr:unnamed protein product [Brassica oleracea]